MQFHVLIYFSTNLLLYLFVLGENVLIYFGTNLLLYLFYWRKYRFPSNNPLAIFPIAKFSSV